MVNEQEDIIVTMLTLKHLVIIIFITKSTLCKRRSVLFDVHYNYDKSASSQYKLDTVLGIRYFIFMQII